MVELTDEGVAQLSDGAAMNLAGLFAKLSAEAAIHTLRHGTAEQRLAISKTFLTSLAKALESRGDERELDEIRKKMAEVTEAFNS